MRHIGLDLSLTQTGYCIHDPHTGEYTTGVIKSRLKGTQRLHELQTKLRKLLSVRSPAVVSIEGYAMGIGRGGKTFDLGEWGGIARLEVYQRAPETVCLVCPPTNLKQFTAGKGNADKEAVMQGVLRLTGVQTFNDNIADAIGLALVSKAWYTQHPLDSAQQKAMKKVFPAYPIPFQKQPAPRRRRRVG